MDDRAESKKVLNRARGRCEFRVAFGDFIEERCDLPAVIVHHCLGGNGRRVNSAESRAAENKLALCMHCHDRAHSSLYTQVGAPGGPWWFTRGRK